MGGVGGQRREQPQEQRQDEIKSDPETTRDKRDPETKETQRQKRPRDKRDPETTRERQCARARKGDSARLERETLKGR
jgi:hypothetical protein